MNVKKCIDCREYKPKDDFYRCRRHKDGLTSLCKTCDNARRKRHYEDNREDALAKSAAYRVKHREKLRVQQRAYVEKNRDALKAYAATYRDSNRDAVRKACRNSSLVRHFGMTVEDYERMLASQSGVCAICGREETRKRGDQPLSLSVDHCHTTGKIRGLLCSYCNHGIGNFQDDTDRMMRAIKYLEGSR